MKSNASISNHRSEVMPERSGRGALIGALVDRALCPRILDIGAYLLSSESSSRTLLGNEQTAGYLETPGKDTKSPRILTSLTCGGHIDR